MMDTLYIYNTLNRKKEKFEPLTPGFVGIYVCGPTVYDHSHLGHAKSYISFDVIVRYLRFIGYKVRYVQNITDMGHLQGDSEEGEDKVSKQARLQKLEPMEIAEKYTRSYFADMDRLGNLRPDISPRASGHIIEQIEIIKTLIEKDYAYEVTGNVYFDVRKFSGYGKLSGRKIEELEAGARVEVAEDKKYPADFALWKKATPEHIMQWNSPWGKGYPGWHIECSSMSIKYLGETIDIHGGGLENVFPHHECEIAQSECAFDKPFVKYWLHNNMVTVDGVKMGKSLNNFITIKEALKKNDPLAIRYFILMSHYRSALDFSETALDAASSGLKKINNFLNRIDQELENAGDKEGTVSLAVEEFDKKFRAAMNDDFNTPQALAAVFELINDVNKILDDRNQCVTKAEIAQLEQILQSTLGDVLGIITGESGEQETSRQDIDQVMDILLEVRKDLRLEKNFKISDKIRDMLKSHGILLKDTPQGVTWEKEMPRF
jgi:cysteinyl-tRNA synthetase